MKTSAKHFGLVVAP